MNPVQQQAVYERMQVMLGDLQQQYAEKLAELVRDAQGQAEAIVRNQTNVKLEDGVQQSSSPTQAGAVAAVQLPELQRSPTASADEEVRHGSDLAGEAADRAVEVMGRSEAEASSVMPSVAEDPHGDLASEVLAEGEALSVGSEVEDERDGDVSGVEGPSGRVAASSSACAGADPGAREESASPCKPAKAKLLAAVKKVGSKKRKAKKQEGIQCIRTINFEGNSVQPVRCAIAVLDEVWTADWSGRLHVRDRDNVEKIKTDLPSQAIVWCMAFVNGKTRLVWIGQERAGIPVFHAETKQLMCTLTGGHSGNVVAMAVADGPDGRTDIYSAGNDFAVRCWHLEYGTGRPSKEAQVLPGKLHLQIRRGNILHWHSNGVRCLLRLGPMLWSGGDDKAICLWRVADGERLESVEEAHEAGVMSMVIAGRGVWSSGYDGRVKEWSIGGAARQCTREVKFDEPLRALCPVGDHVWMCGQSHNIMVYASDMTKVDSLEGHGAYVSSLLLVDRSETRLMWSSSLADKSLRVWRHVLRGGSASVAELTAANKLYEEQQWSADSKIKNADSQAEQARGELAAAQVEFTHRYEEALIRVAGAERDRELAEAARASSQRHEEAARRAESEALQEAACLREEIQVSRSAQRAAEQEAATKAAAAEVAEAAAAKARMDRDAAIDVIAQKARELTAEQERREELQRELDVVMAEAAGGAQAAAVLRAELKSQGNMLSDCQESLYEETRRCTDLKARVIELEGQVGSVTGERDQSRKDVHTLELRYAELDVFKLDVIARELKNVDKQIDLLFSEAKSLLQASKKFGDYAASNASAKLATTVTDTSTKLRGTVRDVIERCLSETQKLHVGAAVSDSKAAGILKDGGRMAFVIEEEQEASPSKRASKDEPRRDGRRASQQPPPLPPGGKK